MCMHFETFYSQQCERGVPAWSFFLVIFSKLFNLISHAHIKLVLCNIYLHVLPRPTIVLFPVWYASVTYANVAGPMER